MPRKLPRYEYADYNRIALESRLNAMCEKIVHVYFDKDANTVIFRYSHDPLIEQRYRIQPMDKIHFNERFLKDDEILTLCYKFYTLRNKKR